MNTAGNFPSGNPIDPSGNLTPQWRSFFLTLFTRSGGTSGNDTSSLQAAIAKANASIVDLQTEDAQGSPAADMAAVYGLIYAVEAIAAQAMASAVRIPDERGEAGDGATLSNLSQRIADLEAQIEQYRADDGLRSRITELEGQLEHYRADDGLRLRIVELDGRAESGQPMIADASQMTGLGSQYAALIGNPGGQLSSAAPGSSGNLLASNGAAANPSFKSASSLGLALASQLGNFQQYYGFNAATVALSASLAGACIDYYGSTTSVATMPLGSSVAAGGNAFFIFNGGSAALTVQAATGDTWQNWSGNSATLQPGQSIWVVFIGGSLWNVIGGSVQLQFGGISPSFNPVTTSTTAPAAGSASALPATPAGYMTATINGASRKIAYY